MQHHRCSTVIKAILFLLDFVTLCTAWEFPTIFRVFPPFLASCRETAANRSHDLSYIIKACDDVIISLHPIKAGYACVL